MDEESGEGFTCVDFYTSTPLDDKTDKDANDMDIFFNRKALGLHF
jgi:hypothetical protein